MTTTAERPGDDAPKASVPPPRSHLARNVAIAVGVLLVIFIVVLATRPSASEKPLAANAVGRAVPAVQGTTLDGQTFDVDKLRGDWVVVNFFATWCAPCQQEHPELVKFSQQHQAADDGVHVVSVAYDDKADAIRQYFDKKGGAWPVLVGDTGRIALDFGVTGVPESYLVAPNGLVVDKFTGVTAADLDAAIARFSTPASTTS